MEALGLIEDGVEESSNGSIRIGTAGWSIPRAAAHQFTSAGSHLERYARVFSCAEINSSFYRPHAFAVYAKWAALTPPAFQFAVKLPRTITHELKLRRSRAAVEQFLDETSGLGDKRGPILVQLAPSLAFDSRVAGRFLEQLRARYAGPVACEPRHPSWFTSSVDRLFIQFEVARVAADPPRAPGADLAAGWLGLAYVRLHGSPRTYWSRYAPADIQALAHTLHAVSRSAGAWCIFDNTASGAAAENAWELHQLVHAGVT